MLSLTDFTIVSLASLRLTLLVSSENGPGSLLQWLRFRVGVRHDDYGRPNAVPGSLAELLICQKCLSVWTSGICCLTYLTPAWPIVSALAASACVMILLRIGEALL